MISNILKSSNSTTGANKYGQFLYETDCNCGDLHILIRDVYWKSCRLSHVVSHTILNIFSKFALKNVVHDFISCRFKCLKCNKKGNITIDYGSAGCEINFGKFWKVSHFGKNERLFLNTGKLTLHDIKDHVNVLIEEKYKSETYHPIKNNCQHFAEDLYNIIDNHLKKSRFQ